MDPCEDVCNSVCMAPSVFQGHESIPLAISMHETEWVKVHSNGAHSNPSSTKLSPTTFDYKIRPNISEPRQACLHRYLHPTPDLHHE